jgi:hypothetical protein
MPRVLICNNQDRKPHELLKELNTSDDLDFTYTTDLDVFEFALRQRSHELCLVLVREEPSRELVEILSKARSLQLFSGAVSLHAGPSRAGVQAMLKLGVRDVLVEPISARRVAQALRQRLNRTPGPVVTSGTMNEVQRVSADLLTFGRVGKIAAARPEIFVESDLVLAEGDAVTIVDGLPRFFQRERLTFKVLRQDDRDIYYAYHHGYWLGEPDEPSVAGAWDAFLDGVQGDFVQPKPKVLWVTTRRLPEVERIVSPAFHALQLFRPNQVTPKNLARLDPAIVVLDDPSAPAAEAVAAWSSGSRCVLRTERGRESAAPLLATGREESAESWAALTRAVLRPARAESAVELLFPSRSSPVSRCTFALPATVRATAAHAFSVSAPFDIEPDTLIELTGPHFPTRPVIGLYGRVIEVKREPSAVEAILRCEAVPVTDDPQLSPAHGVRPPRVEDRPEILSDDPPPPTLPSRSVAASFVGLGVGLGLALAALGWMWLREEPPPPTAEAAGEEADAGTGAEAGTVSTDEALQGIKSAFDK